LISLVGHRVPSWGVSFFLGVVMVAWRGAASDRQWHTAGVRGTISVVWTGADVRRIGPTMFDDPSGDVQDRSGDNGLLALYSENGAVARAIMEWRHKVIMLYVLTLGGVASAVLWVFQHGVLWAVPLPLFAGCMVTYVLALMDRTNATMLRSCYRVGDGIERRVHSEGAIYSAMFKRSQGKQTITYSRLLRVLFLATSLILGIAGAVVTTVLVRQII
jgi:hypothetical protein